MTLMRSIRQDYRVSVEMLCDLALERWVKSSNYSTKQVEIGFVNIGRMLDWMKIGGYPSNEEADYVEETNYICLQLIEEMNIDIDKFKDQLRLLVVDSPFTVDSADIEKIKCFLQTLADRLKGARRVCWVKPTN